MSDVPMQTDIFGGETPVTQLAPQHNDDEVEAVLRVPGWYLVAKANGGPRTWHILTTAQSSGTAVTACGMRGHVVGESERVITRCPDCLAKVKN